MGEIRVRVRLTNALDAIQRRRNPRKKVRSIEVDAIVDTGATRSVIPAAILKKIGVQAVEEMEARYADGRSEMVKLTDPVRFTIDGRNVTEEAMVLGEHVLIGQTMLEKLDMLADCKNQRLIPNPEHPFGPVSRV